MRIKKALRNGVAALMLLMLCFTAQAQDGKQLFQANCASCHKMDQVLTGPALQGASSRWNNPKMMHLWIKNWPAAVATGDPYAVKIKDFSPSSMNIFTQLSDGEIDAIVKYIDTWAPPVAAVAGTVGSADANAEGDNTLVYGILTLVLAVVAFVLLQVNANLKKLSDDKEGVPSSEPVPFWRNKAYIAFLTVILVLIGGYLVAQGAIGLGRQKGYQPEQPIFYSHKVHAGTNQISCLYCHGGAQDGKHANIPSVNICMNCHKAIKSYKGDPITREDGTSVDGTAEIAKLYKYAGFDPEKPNDWNEANAKPIVWKQIHALPDHVYFNHSQHVKVGQVVCQTCHGEIQKMPEVKQFADLSMGWCINCHRETKVQFKENGFYSIYEKYHEQLRNGKIDSTLGVTVEKIGGTECQKCHY